ncbi:MAG: M14 family zinc carboxypeptidase [Bdellovibrionia bacterium]
MGRFGFLLTKPALILFVILGVSLTGVTNSNLGLLNQNDVRFKVQTPYARSYRLAQAATWLARSGYDVAGVSHETGEIEVITNNGGVKLLQQQGLNGFFPRAEGFAGLDPRYLNPEKVETKLKAINKAFPQLTRLEKIGTSLQGRAIWALLISSTPQANDPRALLKPAIIFDGLHHAREVMTPEVVMDVADTLLSNLATSPRAAQVVATWNIWVVPMVNVDGSNIVHTKDRMWRKNARANNGGVHGVDINRNYQYRWNGCDGSSGTTGAQDYRGTAPASEPETQALIGLVNRVRPTASLSYHSYSELVLYSYGCNNTYTGEKAMVEKIGKELAALLPSDSGKGTYEPGTPWELLYDVDGDSMDHIYASTGALSYTFEINQSFQPSYDLKEPTLKKHRGAWTYFFDRMDKNLLTIAAVDSKGNPVEAEIAIDLVPHNQGELPLRTNAIGRFFKVLDPGNYVITAKTAGGATTTVKVTMSAQPKTVTVKF